VPIYDYKWKCPKCGTTLQLKQRVTLGKRRCPHCATLITTKEIDRQGCREKLAGGCGCLIVTIAFIVWLLSRFN
jgi:hypothetical protein